MKYARVWLQLVHIAFAAYASNRIDSLGYFLGKLVRFGFFWLLIASLFNFTNSLAGYDLYEVLLFFLTFNLIDVGAQVMLRGIYLFRTHIRTGHFDYTLTKPIHPLFFALSRLTDILDLIFLIPIIGLLVYVAGQLSVPISAAVIAWYLAFLSAGMVIVTAFHVIAAAVAVRTVEMENLIWLYRDAMTVGRFPPEVYSPSVQFLFTFIVPIFIVVALPAKIILGIADPSAAVFALAAAAAIWMFAIWFWNTSLVQYSSASS